MANEFKVRKGLVVNGSGSVILDVQGSQGQLFSVTDQLSGSLFSVNDISGVPVLEAFSDSTVKIGQYLAEAIIVSGSTARITGSMSLAGFSAGSVLFAGTGGAISQNNSNFFWDNSNAALAIGGTTIDSNIALQINSTKGIRISGSGGGFGYSIVRGTETSAYVNNGSITVLSSTNTLAFNTGGSEAARFTNNKNLLINTTSDSGERLQVSGSSRFMGNMVITGSGDTTATNALTIVNSSSANMLRMLNDTTLKIGSQNIDIFPTANGSTVSNAGRGLVISTNASSQTDVGALKIVGAYSSALGSDYGLWISHIFTNGTSGVATHNGILLNQTINQTSGANGITRGIYVNPTLTSAWDYRSIEWTNNASATSGSWGLYGAGTAPNFLSGSLGIGITTPSSSIHINSSTVNNAFLITTPNNNTTLYPFFIGGATLTSDVYLRANSSIIEFRRNGNPSTIRTVGASNNLALEGSQHIVFSTNGANERARFTSGGNLLLNDTVDDTFNRLQVTGNARISQALTASQALISGSGTQRLTVVGSGSAQPLFTVQGSQGELFSIVDSLSGSLFSVNDQSGLPIMEVFSDNTTLVGNYLAPMLLTTNRTSSAAGINTIYSLPTSSYDAVYIDYTIRSGSNARAGNFMAMWSGTSVNFTDNSITEFGSTSAFTFGAHVSGANMVVTGSAPTAGWTIKTIIKAI